MIKILLPLTLLSLNCFAYDRVPYNRAVHYGKSIDIDGDCQDTRSEILIKESENNGVAPTFIKREDGKNCTVATGKFIDFYTNTVYTNAKDIDIDHVLPPYIHYNTVGKYQSKKKNAEFYNDTENLVITSLSLNRSKGKKDLSEFIQRVPRENRCRYIAKYDRISVKYDITVDNSDNEIINQNPACFNGE
jgi:hypothetical protein